MADKAQVASAQAPASMQHTARFGRILAALMLIFLLAELGAQIFTYAWSGHRYVSFSPYRWFPYGLVRNNPQLTSPSFHINANGFRNIRSFTIDRPPRTLRVIMLGGSVLYSGLGRYIIPGTKRVKSTETIAQYLYALLKQDKAFQGLRIEVINAAVNFNRINETSTSYLAEYIHWKPDVIMFFGSSNNFGDHPFRSQVYKRQYGIQPKHAWHNEFDRQANRHSFSTWLEHGSLTLQRYTALAGLLNKGMDWFIDTSFILSKQHAFVKKPPPKTPLADHVEVNAYFNEYTGHVAAVAAAAQHNKQHLVFFWEYYISSLKGLKPFSPKEKILYKHNVVHHTKADLRYLELMRQKFVKHMKDHKIDVIDPMPELRNQKRQVFVDYLHYTKEGNEFMAGVVYKRLRGTLLAIAERRRTEATGDLTKSPVSSKRPSPVSVRTRASASGSAPEPRASETPKVQAVPHSPKSRPALKTKATPSFGSASQPSPR